MQARNIQDLIDHEDPGIDLLREWAGRPDANPTTFLDRDPDLAERTLVYLAVSTRSILGAIVFETGGISIAGGLIRLWGSGSLRSLLQSNQVAAAAAGRELPGILFVGDDALGGLFAINGGCFGTQDLGDVFYLPADEERWTSLEVGHSDFVAWCITGNLEHLYGDTTSAARMLSEATPAFDRVLASFPFAWTQEGRTSDTSIREISAAEFLRLRIEMSGFATE